MSVRLVLADDHRMLREALASLLAGESDFQVAGEAGTAHEALEQVASIRPDVLVLDVGLPDMTGIEVARRLSGSSTKVVMLSAHHDKRFVQEAFKAGAKGYVAKISASDELVRAVRAVSQGQTYVSPEIAGALVRAVHELSPGTSPPSSVLGRREREVLARIAEGLRSTQIATRMKIKVGTVEAHRRNIARKLDLHTVADLTKYALREGLTSHY